MPEKDKRYTKGGSYRSVPKTMRIFEKRRGFDAINEPVAGSMTREIDRKDLDFYYDTREHAFEKDAFPPRYYEENMTTNNRTDRRVGNENEQFKRKQSISGLVRKLNCAASKKQNEFESDYWNDANSIAECSPDWKFASPALKPDSSSQIRRPVVITVNNGGPNELPPFDHKNMDFDHARELKSSFICGEFPKPSKIRSSTSFRLGTSARKRQHNGPRCFSNLSTKNIDGVRSGSEWRYYNLPDHDEVTKKKAAQEAARRERWKRGFEMERRMMKNTKTTTEWDKYRDDASTESGEESHTTGTSLDTEEDSMSTDDWTYATDESQLKYYYDRRRTSSGHCTSRKQIVQSVAEDFGIFAKLLLSDGYACFGTAADITRETVGGCKGE